MNNLINKYTIIVMIMAALAVIAFAAIHVSCHSGAYSLCLLTVCAFLLVSTGISLSLFADPLLVNLAAGRGVSIPFRLEKPPRF